MKKNSMIISIFASVGSQNLGDELILKNEIKLLEEKYGRDTLFQVFTYDVSKPFLKQKNIKYYEYFPVGLSEPGNIFRNIKNFFTFLKKVKQSGLIVIGGGGILYDEEFQTVGNPLKQWLWRTRIFRFYKKKILFFAVGLSIKKKKNLAIIASIFGGKNNDSSNQRGTEITVRDKYSHNLLAELDIASKIVLDPVFSDNGEGSDALKKRSLVKKVSCKNFQMSIFSDINFSGSKVGISFRQGYLKNEIKNIKNIIEYIQDSGGEVILLPTSFHKTDDLANDKKFLRYFSIKYGVKMTKNMKETYGVFQKKEIDVCLAMRLHSMILSQVYAIPFFAFSYSKKTDEVIKNNFMIKKETTK